MGRIKQTKLKWPGLLHIRKVMLHILNFHLGHNTVYKNIHVIYVLTIPFTNLLGAKIRKCTNHEATLELFFDCHVRRHLLDQNTCEMYIK